MAKFFVDSVEGYENPFHWHRCDDCGRVWWHRDDASGDPDQHACPACGEGQWRRYHPRWLPVDGAAVLEAAGAAGRARLMRGEPTWTAYGLFLAAQDDYGTFAVAVDGRNPVRKSSRKKSVSSRSGLLTRLVDLLLLGCREGSQGGPGVGD